MRPDRPAASIADLDGWRPDAWSHRWVNTSKKVSTKSLTPVLANGSIDVRDIRHDHPQRPVVRRDGCPVRNP